MKIRYPKKEIDDMQPCSSNWVGFIGSFGIEGSKGGGVRVGKDVKI